MNSQPDSSTKQVSEFSTGEYSDPRDTRVPQNPSVTWEDNSEYQSLNDTASTVENTSSNSLRTVFSKSEFSTQIPPLNTSHLIGKPSLRPRLKTSLDALANDDDADTDDFIDEESSEISTEGGELNTSDFYIEDDDIELFKLPEPTLLTQLSSLNTSLTSSEEERSHSSASIVTIKRNMAKVTVAVKTAMAEYERAITSYDLIFDLLEPPNVPAEELKNLQQEATTYRKALIDSLAIFATEPHELFTEAKREKATTYVTHYSNKLKLIYIQVKSNDDLSARRATENPNLQNQPNYGIDTRAQQATICSQRVTRMLPSLKQAVLDINAKFTETRLQPIGSAMELKGADNTFKQNCDAMAETTRHIDDLVRNATTANDDLSIEILDGLSISLNKSKRDTRSRLDAVHGSLGIIPGMIDSGLKGIQVDAPSFSGKFSEEPDFFTFSKQLEEYFSQAGALSTAQKLLKLRNDCLSSPAKECIAGVKTYDVAIHVLKTHFGKPTMVFMNKVQDLKNCGKCPERILEKRNWIFNITQRITALTELATDHGLTMMFESSNIVGVLQKLMLPKDHEEFRKVLREEMRAKPDMYITRGYTLEAMLGFLEDTAIDTNCDIDYMAASSFGTYRELMDGMNGSKPKRDDYGKTDSQAKDSKKSNPVKKYAAAAAVDDDSDDMIDLEEVSEDSDDCSANITHHVGNDTGLTPSASTHPSKIMNNSSVPREIKCKSCDNHHTSLAYCKDYQETPIRKRWRKIMKQKACYRCLRMDAGLDMDNRSTWLKAHLKNCDSKWLCDIDKCASKDEIRKNHCTTCPYHQEENRQKVNDFIKTLDRSKLECDAKFLFAYLANPPTTPESDAMNEAIFLNGKDKDTIEIEPEVKSCPIYQLQYVAGKNNEKLMVFYDNGCWSSGLSNNAYAALDTATVREGPTVLQVAGGAELSVPYGKERFWLELDKKGKNNKTVMAVFTGLRMENVSCQFPKWPLRKVYDEVSAEFFKLFPSKTLPSIEETIGNQAVDIMVGIQYNMYHPQLLFSLPGGLEIRQGLLKAWNGNQAVLAGPHPLWEHVSNASSYMGPGAYLTSEFKAYRVQCDTLWNNPVPTHESPVSLKPPTNWSLFCECGELNENPLVDDDRAVISAMYAVSGGKMIKEFQLLDEIGTELNYRCVKCRQCNPCKDGERIEQRTLKEDQESYQIKHCVSYDPELKVVVTELPFIQDPDTHLTENKNVAVKILESQIKVAAKDDGVKNEILRSFNKLVENGHLIKLDDLPDHEQQLARRPGYWIPWRAVHSSSSISTPTRLVFDASSRTRTGHSLNDILAKGDSKVADLLHLLIQFRKGKAALTSDIKMAYNTVKIKPEFYRYQKMVWKEFLSIDSDTIDMIIRTLIYGVKPAGQLTAEGFELVADVAEDANPDLKLGADTLRNKKYVDDILASYDTSAIRDAASDGLPKVLDYGTMEVKTITKSGSPPDEIVSIDGTTCGLVGYKWAPEEDLIGLDIKPLYLGKSKRGKLPPFVKGNLAEALEEQFTKRIITGKVASFFDPVGIFVPISAGLKLDLSEICKLKIDWDDKLPVTLLDTWVHNLEQIQLLDGIMVPRSIFNNDVNVANGVNLLVCTDASQSIAIATVYAQMDLNNGGKVCNLIMSKSKLVTKLTVPKAELKACNMGCVLAAIVKRDFGECINKIVFVTDSVISMYWMSCDSRPLQTAVRNMVIDIRRLCNVEDWRHVESSLNPADVATRPADIKMIGPTSVWQLGKEWMREPIEQMPLKSLTEISLDHEEQRLALQEIRNSGAPGMTLMAFGAKINEIADFSDYLIDPKRYLWNQLLRKVAVLFVVSDCLRGKRKLRNDDLNTNKSSIYVDEADIKKAESYIFKKTTKELFEFNDWKKLDTLGKMKDGIFLYTGRILAGPEAEFADAMVDLTRLSYAVPVLDRNSPIAFCIMRTCHEKLTHHGGVVSTLLKSFEYAYILGGRSLAAEIRSKCLFCQRYKVKTIDIEMGKIDESRYQVAPAFTICQLDLFGPFDLKCQVHQKKTRNTESTEAWGVAIKCCTTSAIGLYVMVGYDTDNFLLAFQRHIYRYGTPVQVRIDAGSQLVKGMREMKIFLADIAKTINCENGSSLSFKIAPPGAHNWNGIVERSIKEIRKVLNTVFKGRYFSVIQFETALGYIANELNNLPFCLRNRYNNLDGLDLLTPNRMLLGRNNGRSAMGRIILESPGPMIQSMAEIEKAWWNVFQEVRLADFFPKSRKWTHTSLQPKVGQIVIFLRDTSNTFGSSIFRLGKIKTVFTSKDGVARKVEIEYRLFNSKNTSSVIRSLRNVAVLEIEENLDLGGQLAAAATEMSHLWCYFNEVN